MPYRDCARRRLVNLLACSSRFFRSADIQSQGAEAFLPWRRPWMSSGTRCCRLIAYLIGAFAIDTMLMKNSLMRT